MQPPSPDPDSIFAALLKDLPPETESLARHFRAFVRPRKIKTVAELLRLVLLFAGLDHSEREIAANAVLVHPEIESLSAEAVRERLAACLPWLQALLPTLLQRTPPPPLPAGVRVLVLDASDIVARGQRSVTWRLHLVLGLVAWRLHALQLTDVQTGETLLNFAWAAGDVVLADRGYSHRAGVAHVVECGGAVVVRCQVQQFPLTDPTGQALDVAAALRDCLPGETRTLPVQFTPPKGRTYTAFLHAYRLGETAAAAARRRCGQSAKKGGYTPKAATLFLAEFVLVLTTVPPSVLSGPTVLAWYRCRWQVELLFKQYKSLLHLDEVRARAGSVLGQVWLHGKLLYACLLEQRARQRCGPDWTSLDGARRGTYWRVWELLQQEVAPLITLVACWDVAAWPAALTALTERKRRRQLQTLPLAVVVWLYQPAPNAAAALKGKA